MSKFDQLWDGSALHVPPLLLDAYRKVLTARGWAPTGRGGAVGGETVEEARDHFCSVFPASVCRHVAFVRDPLKRCLPIPEELALAFSTGRLRVLDLVCGAGSASLGLLATVATLRESGALPCLPLSVAVRGADISTTSLQIFEQLVTETEPLLRSVGIEVTCEYSVWDATQPLATRDLVEEFFSSRVDHDALVVVSLISGTAGSETRYANFKTSFEHIKLCTVGKGTLLWAEPGLTNKKGTWLLNKIRSYISSLGVPKAHSVATKYDWYEPFNCATHPCEIGAVLVRRGMD